MRWIEIAERGETALREAAPHGSTLARRAEVAKSLGVTGQTLGNYIDALRFVRELRSTDPAAASSLARMNPTSIAVYARWARRDRDGALAHIATADRLGFSTARIIADERASRQALPPSPTLLDIALGRQRPTRPYRFPAGDLAIAFGRCLGQAPVLADLSPTPPREEMGVSMIGTLRFRRNEEDLDELDAPFRPSREPWFRDRDPNGPYDVMGFIGVERGRAGDGHRRNARATLAKAVLLASVYPVVVVMLEDDRALVEFGTMLPALDRSRLGPHALVGPNLFAFARDAGSVLLAEPESFLPRNWH